jgi:hypothetical protein
VRLVSRCLQQIAKAAAKILYGYPDMQPDFIFAMQHGKVDIWELFVQHIADMCACDHFQRSH